VWVQEAGTNLPFHEVLQAVDGIPPITQGSHSLGQWEMRGDALYFNGGTSPVNIRLRYLAAFPVFFGCDLNYEHTYVPIKDCEDCVAAQAAYQYDIGQGSMSPEMIAGQLADYKDQIYQLRLSFVRAGQGKQVSRQPYRHDAGLIGY
jgi:hypothetical protein